LDQTYNMFWLEYVRVFPIYIYVLLVNWEVYMTRPSGEEDGCAKNIVWSLKTHPLFWTLDQL